MLRRQPTDVLLADIGMPEQDGYALIEAVRALQDANVQKFVEGKPVKKAIYVKAKLVNIVI